MEKVAEALGWKPEDLRFPEEKFQNASEAARKKAAERHAAELFRRAQEAVDLQRQGTGRKAALSVHEKVTTTAPQQPEGMSRGELLAKAQSAVVEGKITAIQAARVESYVNRGLQPPEDLLSAIIG